MKFRQDVLAMMMAVVAMVGLNQICSADPPPHDLLRGPSVSEEATKEPPRRPGERMRQQAGGQTPLREWVAALRELDLDAEQKRQIREIADEFFKARREFMMSRSESERELMDEMPRLRQQQREPNRRQREMIERLESQRPKIEKYQRRMWATLTPQQQDQFRSILAERRERQMQSRSDRRERRGNDMAGDDNMMQMQPEDGGRAPAERLRARDSRRGAALDEMAQRRLRFLRSHQSKSAGESRNRDPGTPAPEDRTFTFDEDQRTPTPDE